MYTWIFKEYFEWKVIIHYLIDLYYLQQYLFFDRKFTWYDYYLVLCV